MNWWAGNTLRLVQNNLREVDADLDVDKLISQLKSMDANVLMMNAGGMFAFYPSQLPYQYVTPYLKKDLLGESIQKAHKNGIRFIARFDFSKAHESIFRQRPEWFYRTSEGREVNYFGIVHTCLNGGYQQENSLAILEEALSAYDVDGVFFNMFGYQNWDYSGNYYGTCHCDNCRARFREMYGLELPAEEDRGNETFRKYREFQEKTSMDILEKISAHIKKLRPDIAISTYHHHKVDIVRHESNTALNRPLPKWLYSAAENIMPIMGSYEDKLVSNCSINAIDLTYRFTGVSRQESEIRLYESLLSGSGLDFCIIGAFEGYPDRENLETVSSIFRYHKQHEKWFGQFQSLADVVLVKPSPSSVRDSSKEYLGVFKMLKESHIQFDVIKQDRLERLAASPAKIVILPGVERLDEEQLKKLAEWRMRGLHILATGGSLAFQPKALQELFHATADQVIHETTASYVRIDDKGMFPQLAQRDWVVVDGAFNAVTFSDGVAKSLPYIAQASFGPPERAYGHVESSELYALGIKPPGSDGNPGGSAYVCWNVGELYYRHGFSDYRWILLGALNRLVPEEQRTLSTNAHPSVEIALHRLSDGSRLLQLLNLSGFNGMTYEEPIPFGDIEVRVQGWPPSGNGEKPSRPISLTAGDIRTTSTTSTANGSLTSGDLISGDSYAGDRTASSVPSSGSESVTKATWRTEDGATVLVVPKLTSYAAFHLKA
ncbi:alpha-amylase family protein [Paenibacillus sp. CAU 1782]